MLSEAIEAAARAIIASHQKDSAAEACCCLGPQNGEPACPCRMRHAREDAKAALEGVGFEGLVTEIERLRSLAGAVSDGPSMADIKRDLRGGSQ